MNEATVIVKDAELGVIDGDGELTVSENNGTAKRGVGGDEGWGEADEHVPRALRIWEQEIFNAEGNGLCSIYHGRRRRRQYRCHVAADLPSCFLRHCRGYHGVLELRDRRLNSRVNPVASLLHGELFVFSHEHIHFSLFICSGSDYRRAVHGPVAPDCIVTAAVLDVEEGLEVCMPRENKGECQTACARSLITGKNWGTYLH